MDVSIIIFDSKKKTNVLHYPGYFRKKCVFLEREFHLVYLSKLLLESCNKRFYLWILSLHVWCNKQPAGFGRITTYILKLNKYIYDCSSNQERIGSSFKGDCEKKMYLNLRGSVNFFLFLLRQYQELKKTTTRTSGIIERWI